MWLWARGVATAKVAPIKVRRVEERILNDLIVVLVGSLTLVFELIYLLRESEVLVLVDGSRYRESGREIETDG
jgi:hypothetical protein